MDILFVGNLPPYFGGAGIANAVVLRGLSARGHRVRAASPITPDDASAGDWFSDTHPQLAVRRFLVPFYRLAHWPRVPEYVEPQTAGLRRIVNQELDASRPDILLTSEVMDSAILDTFHRIGIPSALIVHGGTLRKVFLGLGPEEEVAEARDFYRRVDHRIAVAEHLAPTLEQLGLTPITVIQNVVDTELFHPRERDETLLRELRITERDLVTAHMSNLKPIKRPLDFVHAAGLALARDPRLLFVVGGAGECQIAMQETCARYGIIDRFRFPGWLRSDRVHKYYSIFDLVVMPSESEARSMVYLETQASGRVLIASDIPAAREAIEDGVTGLLYPLGSSEALAEKILLAAASPELRQTIGRQARVLAETRTLAGYAEAYERTLRDLVSRGPRRLD